LIPTSTLPDLSPEKRVRVLAILREQKVPAERRAPLSPKQVAEMLSRRPHLAVWVQPSADRCFSDEEYVAAGAELREDLTGADFLLGIKERKPETLVSDAHYLIFSHTIKEQPGNRRLLQTVLERGCRLTDYETITDENGHRLVAFGHFAGVVGTLHALRMAGIRKDRFEMKAPREYHSLPEALQALDGADLSGLRVVLTGQGRVSAGAVQVLIGAGFTRISPEEFLAGVEDGPCFTQLSSKELYEPADGSAWKGSQDFYAHPEKYRSSFAPYLQAADILITGAFWGPGYPRLFATADLAAPTCRLRIIADVSCDLEGAVPCTLRASTIESPYFDIDPSTGHELPPFSGVDMVTMMTVDNLPCEMPAEATRHFGRQFLDNFLDDLLLDGPIARRATIAQKGQLAPAFQYLTGYAAPEEVVVE